MNKQSIKNLVTCTFILSIFLTWAAFFIIPAIAQGATYYVNPNGSNANIGTSLNHPFQTISKAINTAEAGDTIQLTSGEYRENIVSMKNGTVNAPITITGPADAIIKGGENDRVIEINHNYHTLNGFTVDGLHGSPTEPSGYRDTLIYTLGKQTQQGVEGLKVTNMTLKNAGGECLRLRYFVTKAEIAHNTITNCGVHAFVFNTGGKNGEGIYIGTSNKQWGDGKNPTNDPDETKDNTVHDNYIDTQGNECVDIKEGATKNIIEYNTCRGQKDSESGGFDSRGDENIFRYNDVRNSIGAGVRLGGALVDGTQYGKNNEIYGNTIIDNKNGGVRFQVTPQVKVCGNTMSDNTNGDSVGSFGSQFNPTQPCEENTAPAPSNTNEPTKIIKNTGSLANTTTLIAHSNNFSADYEPLKLWDGCYEGNSYNSNTCTGGGRNIPSFWLEFDFGKLYDLSQARLYGDKDGKWVSKVWTFKYKKFSSDPWTVAFLDKDAFVNNWATESLNIKARYARVEVLGDNINYTPGHTQARELEIYGTEAMDIPANTNIPIPSATNNKEGNDSIVSTPPPEAKENSVNNNIPISSITNDESGNDSIVSTPPLEAKEIPIDSNTLVTDGEGNNDSIILESAPNLLNVFATPTIPNSILVSQNNGGQKLQILLIKYSAIFLKEIAAWYFGPIIIVAVQNGLILYSVL